MYAYIKIYVSIHGFWPRDGNNKDESYSQSSSSVLIFVHPKQSLAFPIASLSSCTNIPVQIYIMYKYTYIFIYEYLCVYIYIYIYLYIHIYISYIYMYIYKPFCTYVHVHIICV